MYCKSLFLSLCAPFLLCLLAFSSLKAQPTSCFDFDFYDVDEKFGKSAGHESGDTINLIGNDVITTLQRFNYSNSDLGDFQDVTVVDWDLGNDFGAPNKYLFISNINLSFDFSLQPDRVSMVSFDFIDSGGQVNIGVNGNTVHILEFLHEAPIEIAPGVRFEVYLDSLTTIPSGTIILYGDIKQLVIGGQELGFDNFCFVVNDVPPMCINNVIAKPEPCTPNGIFYTEITFDFNNPASDSFYIRGNGQNYGKFPYGQSSYKVGPIEANPNTELEFVIIDANDPNCINFTEIGPISCNENDCKIYDLWAQTGSCQTDGTQELYFNFSLENVEPVGFIVLIDGEIHRFFDFNLTADSVGYFLEGLKLREGEHKLTVCSEADIDGCCETIVFYAANCNNDCRIFDIETNISDCQTDGTFDVKLNFEHEALNGEMFTVLLDDGNYHTFNLQQLPITLEGLKINSSGNWIEVCVNQSTTINTDDNFECCTKIELETPICDSSCKIYDIVAETTDCYDNGTFDLLFKFLNQNAYTAGFDTYIDGEYYEFISFTSTGGYKFPNLQLPAGPHTLTICGNDSPNCCQTIIFVVPDCNNTANCKIYDVFAESHPCDANGEFLVDLEFKIDQPKAARFKIVGNGRDYGIFEYGRPFYTVGPIKGDGETVYEFIIIDLENPNCNAFTIIEPTNCTGTNDCLLNDLRSEISDCSDSGTIDIEINFKFDNPTDRGFNVFIDEKYIETYGFHQVPFVLNQMNLPSGEHKLSICRNDAENCCISTIIFIPECGVCSITNVNAITTDCENEDYFYVDLQFDVAHPSSDRFRVVGNSNLYGVFEYGKDDYRIGPLDGDGEIIYEFIVQDLNNETCASFVELERTVNCEQGFVWPGDANFDNVTDNFDLLNIGLTYGKRGPERMIDSFDVASALVWEAQEAIDWDFEFRNGINIKHADCNGDGIINEADVKAIEENYFFSHGPIREKMTSTGNENDPALYVDFPALANTEIGREIKAPIIFGNTNIPAEAYGLAFTLKFDPNLIKDAKIEFTESWMGTPNENLLSINKNFSSDGLIDVSLTRYDRTNPFGAGAIGNFIVIIDDIQGYSGESQIEIQKVQAIDNEGNVLAVHTPKTILSSLTETEEETDDNIDITIYPNPTTDVISIEKKIEKSIESVQIQTVSGKIIKTISPQLVENIDISDLANGVYIISIQMGTQTFYRKLVKQ